MDFLLVFARLFPGENVHPRAADVGVSYDDLANGKWRGSRPIPSLEECQAAWAAILTERPELSLPTDRLQAAVNKQAAQQALAGTSPADFRFRALARLLYRNVPALRNAFPTPAAYRQAIAAAIAAETGPNS